VSFQRYVSKLAKFSYAVLHNNSLGGNGCQHFRTVFFIAEPFSGGKQILQKVVLCLGYSSRASQMDAVRTDGKMISIAVSGAYYVTLANSQNANYSKFLPRDDA